jgi:hypothetical protein
MLKYLSLPFRQQPGHLLNIPQNPAFIPQNKYSFLRWPNHRLFNNRVPGFRINYGE